MNKADPASSANSQQYFNNQQGGNEYRNSCAVKQRLVLNLDYEQLGPTLHQQILIKYAVLQSWKNSLLLKFHCAVRKKEDFKPHDQYSEKTVSIPDLHRF